MHQHKKQLHERILRRQSALQSELELMRDLKKASCSVRERALADALGELSTHLSTGWDKVDGMEASELTRWLESTRFLVDDSRVDERAEAIFVHLESQWKLALYGVPEQAESDSEPALVAAEQ